MKSIAPLRRKITGRTYPFQELFYIYDFYCLQIIQMFLPFVILVVLNLVILQKLIESKSVRHMLHTSLKQMDSNQLNNNQPPRQNNGALFAEMQLKNGTHRLKRLDNLWVTLLIPINLRNFIQMGGYKSRGIH